MQYSSTQSRIFIISILIVVFSSCGNGPDPEWLDAIPESTVILNIEDDKSNNEILRNLGELVLEPLVIDDYIGFNFGTAVKASALIPEGVDKVSPLWLLEADLKNATQSLKQSGWIEGGNYKTTGGSVHLFRRGQNTLSAGQLGKWLVLSTRSNAIEQSLLAKSGKIPHFEETGLTGLHLNASGLGRLLSPIAAPAYRAALSDLFNGLGVLHIDTDVISTVEKSEFTFKIPFKGVRSPLISYLEAKQSNPVLNFQVPMGMSVMIHLQDPIGQMPYDSLRRLETDNPISNSTIDQLIQIMDAELTFYVQEGASGNTAWVRKADTSAAKSIFETLNKSGLVDSFNGVYRSRNPYLARAVGTRLSNIDQMIIGLGNNEIIISSNQTLVNRLMDVPPSSMRNLSERLPEFIEAGMGVAASAVWIDLNKLLTTARSAGWLTADKSLPPFLQSISELGSRIHVTDDAMYVHLKVNRSDSSPFNEELVMAWQYPLRGESVVAVPQLAQIAGKKAVILTTDRGRVLGFSTDGSLIFNQDVGSNSPISGAFTYDWFGNKSPIVFQAAGNSIYAWSPTGSILPRFPFVFEASISAPIIVTDSNKDGEPEFIVATEDQRLHLINRDGKVLEGWPVSTNGVVRSNPIVSFQNDSWQIRVETESSIEVFNRKGDELKASTNDKRQEAVADTLNGLPANSPFLNFSQARLVPFPLSIDLDDDGIQELIIVYDGQVRCYRIQRNASN